MRQGGPWLGRTALVAAVLGLGLPCDLGGQTRRALIIGINAYDRLARPAALAASGRDSIPNLDGSVNDALAIRDLLQARFGFEAAHIRVLLDTAATRDGMLAAIRRLTAEAQPGDIVFFFYAGHGSQRRNSLSARPTKLDQTLVPADANGGAFDIRDKELARLFGALLHKGVALTLIFDSCHSGAITRGVAVAYKERWAAADPRDAADPETPPAPEDHGALVISSAQDYQTAAESKDDAGTPHGVFASALLTVLRSVPPDEPATRIFQQVKAIMQSGGRMQEPVLAGTTARRRQPLIGGGPGARGQTTVAVLRHGAPGQVELQGGVALGLRQDSELVPFGRRPGTPAIRLKVMTVLGLSRSTAEVVQGVRDSIRPGDLFAVERWSPPPVAGLRVWMPTPGLDGPARVRLAAELGRLAATPGIELVDDPTVLPADSTPLAVVHWRSGGWAVEVGGRAAAQLPHPLTASAVQRAVRSGRDKVRVFVLLPPSQELAQHLDIGRGTRNDLVQVVAERADADYLLVGRVREGRIEYAWMRPNASPEMARASTLPLLGEWVADGAGAAEELVEQALRLAKVRSWLEMPGPPSDGRFPYRLALRDPRTGELKTEGPVYDGEWYGLVLHADSAEITPSIEQRRVYVFGIARNGSSVLLFPRSNVLNRVPYAPTENGSWPREIRLGRDSLFPIGEPFGMDTYILLTSDEVVPTEALEWEGVRRGVRGGGSPLARLMFSASSATRAAVPPVPVNWSIQRLLILSAVKPAGRH